ncbi:MAG: hypothetical protein ACK5EU_09240 [Pseudanabaena sp.]
MNSKNLFYYYNQKLLFACLIAYPFHKQRSPMHPHKLRSPL